eukprot:CAMPEP_0204167998 /NCGR_PEP_ID=MMETSP0361-20130328/40350_1 /ASSEMBLY_ACC=CAM_ASM_000343 /TAXON_ID=268821 /ORGANISM="Scrippsiella Hangoei, Strain SHTV-5" /LENGTH=61 /DNA_ID=CAMNT_0051125391 /DNA_START=199 /DNA_END=380 /DNA_ORIENTATION=-
MLSATFSLLTCSRDVSETSAEGAQVEGSETSEQAPPLANAPGAAHKSHTAAQCIDMYMIAA